jgi:hypothetical protein
MVNVISDTICNYITATSWLQTQKKTNPTQQSSTLVATTSHFLHISTPSKDVKPAIKPIHCHIIGGAENTVCIKPCVAPILCVIIPSIYQLTNKLL